MDLRPGGMYHFELRAADGNTMWAQFIYREIVAPERIVYVNSFSDEKAGRTRHPMSLDWPLEMLTTLLFEDVGDRRTKLTVTSIAINESEDERATFNAGYPSMTQGWTGQLDKLDVYLADVKNKKATV